MNNPITITEVRERAVQGMTRPFLCEADDFASYYVKGAYAGMNSLCCEWVANRLVNLALPSAPLGLPRFNIAEVPRELIANSARQDIADLGAGLVFASMRIMDGQELSWSAAQGWPEETMALLLLLDLWIQNEDRSLSEFGGNPNLLVVQIPPLPDDDPEGALWVDQPRREMLWAYDFDLAFDEDFNRERFFGAHVFGGMLKEWPEGFRERMEPMLKAALDEAPAIFSELPLEWLHMDGDESLPVQLEEGNICSGVAIQRSRDFLETAMNNAVCNYALLRFLPYPETGEFVNVGVVVNCLQPCFLRFISEIHMPDRAKALFPKQSERKYEAAQAAMQEELDRVAGMVAKARDAKGCQIAFNEVVRARESVLRFGEVRTIASTDAKNVPEELFRRYVLMETAETSAPTGQAVIAQGIALGK